MSSKTEDVSVIEESLIKTFNAIASTYDRGRKLWLELIEEIFKIKKNPTIILDEGCGTGRLLASLSTAYEVIGIDISFEMLEIAKKRIKRRKVELNSHLINASMVMKPFRDSVFEVSLIIASIHHIPLRKRRVKALKESYRVLKEGGIVLVTAWNLLLPTNLVRALRHFMSSQLFEFGDAIVPWKKCGKILHRYYHFYLRKELKDDVSKAGFKVIRSYRWDNKGFIAKRNIVCIAIK